MAEVIRDPRTLPHFLTIDVVCELMQRGRRTIEGFVSRGDWKPGEHYVRRGKRTRLYVRDAVLAWMNYGQMPAPRRSKSGANFDRSPGLAAAYEREHGL